MPIKLRITFILALLATLALSACGFHLRGASSTQLPFKSIYIGLPDTSSLGSELKRYIRASSDTVIATDPKEAQANFEVLSEQREKVILSLNSQGRVREYTLLYRFNFRVKDSKGQELLPATDITLKRLLSYNESEALSKELEEQMLYREMQSDLVQQILRRLAALRTT
jgi:LPS-assembly lipoprotein